MLNHRLVIPDREEAERELPVMHPWWRFQARFNVAVPQRLPVVRVYEGQTEGVMMRWGFVPEPSKTNITLLGPAVVRAGAVSTLEETRHAWLSNQRGIVPVTGFYMWHLTPRGYRQPYFVRLVNREVFGLAVLWERAVTEDDDVIESCAVLNVAANALLAGFGGEHPQMPAIVRRQDYESWLTQDAAGVGELLLPYPHEQMVAHPVSPHVNDLRFDDPRLIRPLA